MAGTIAEVGTGAVSHLTDPGSILGHCRRDIQVCSAGFVVGALVVIIIYLIWKYFIAKEHLSLASTVYGPPSAAANIMRTLNGADPVLSPSRERMATIKNLWS